MTLGLTSRGAEIVDQEKRGKGERTLTVVAVGFSRNAAERAARHEGSSIIPYRDQDVEFIEKERSLGPVNNRYLFRVTHNSDEGGY